MVLKFLLYIALSCGYLVACDGSVSGASAGHGRTFVGKGHLVPKKHPEVPGVVRGHPGAHGHAVPRAHAHNAAPQRREGKTIVLERLDEARPHVKKGHTDAKAPEVPPPIPKLERPNDYKKGGKTLVDLVVASANRHKDKIVLDITRDDNLNVTKVCKTKPIKGQDVYAAQCDYSPDPKTDVVKIVAGNHLIWNAMDEKFKVFYLTVVFKDGNKYLSFRVSKHGKYRLETKHASDVNGHWEMLSEVDYNNLLAGVKVPEPSAKEVVLDISHPDTSKFDEEYVTTRGVNGIRYTVKEGVEHITRIVDGNSNAGSLHNEKAGAAALVAGHGDLASVDDDEEYIWKAAVEGNYCIEAFVYPNSKKPKVLSIKTRNPEDDLVGSLFFIKKENKWSLADKIQCFEELKKLKFGSL